MSVQIQAKGRDGGGWYIIEVTPSGRFLRHWTRFNLKEAALSSAAFLFPGEECVAMWWTGTEWVES